ncbi:MAG: acyl-CoA dehydrogenase [Telmatospirillum sp.]|nr:acyl-CoA dehydrogenase [Telmatospirillum sp.]
MDFQLSEEQTLIRNMVHEFVEQHVRPMADEIDRNHRFPEESIAPMAELGLFGFNLPEQYGGSGIDSVAYAVASEEMAKVSASHAMIMGSQCTLTTPILVKYASDEIKERIIPKMIAGEALGCFCLTEPGAGCDAASQRTSAVRQGDSYVLNGSKMWITNAPQSKIFIVFAMTDFNKGVKGISAFLVERGAPGAEGLSTGHPEEKMGMGASHTTEVVLKNVVVPAANRLGAEGQGFKIAMETLDGGRGGGAAMATGLAQAALDSTVAYTKERVQFGRPIAANQGVQWMIADMATRIECARLMTHRAAAAKDSGLPCTKESAMAKLYATETAMYVTEKAVQLHGGLGYTRAFAVERLMREAKLTEIFEGTSEIQRIVIAGQVLR